MKHLLHAVLIILILLIATGCGGGNGPVWPPPNGDGGRVPNYDLLYPDIVCRWDDDAFPLKVYIDPHPSSDAFAHQLYTAALEGIDMWDNVIDGIPDPFIYEPDIDSTDITARWELMNLSGYTLATKYKDHIAIRKMAINVDIRDPESIRLIMGHELGHVLGLDLSGVSNDLMYSHIYPGITTLTQRDSDMINWLYSQENYVPIYTY